MKCLLESKKSVFLGAPFAGGQRALVPKNLENERLLVLLSAFHDIRCSESAVEKIEVVDVGIGENLVRGDLLGHVPDGITVHLYRFCYSTPAVVVEEVQDATETRCTETTVGGGHFFLYLVATWMLS